MVEACLPHHQLKDPQNIILLLYMSQIKPKRRIKSREQTSIRNDEIFNYANKHSGEVGGWFTEDFGSFFHTADGVILPNLRQHVNLPVSSRVWHYHPKSYGMWPSFEDINMFRKDRLATSLIFTSVGVWCLRIDQKKLTQKNQEFMTKVNQMWNLFNQYMLVEQHKHNLLDWHYNKMFQEWASAMRIHGYDIWFIEKNELNNLKPLLKKIENKG